MAGEPRTLFTFLTLCVCPKGVLGAEYKREVIKCLTRVGRVAAVALIGHNHHTHVYRCTLNKPSANLGFVSIPLNLYYKLH